MEKDITLDDIVVRRSSDGTYNICLLETGEVLDKDDKRLNLLLDNQRQLDSINKAKKKGIRKLQGVEDITETHFVNWKNKSNFIKIYRTEMREYKKKVRLSANAGLILFYIQEYIQFGTNKIIKEDGGNFSNSDISELTGISLSSITRALKELEDKILIKRIGNSHKREIYINPYLMCSGNIIEKSTIEMFKNYGRLTPY